jgi:hypothetical protein
MLRESGRRRNGHLFASGLQAEITRLLKSLPR